MIINRETNTCQVVNELERQIRSGKHAPGRKLPSTRELANTYGVSQQVINSAMEILRQRDILVSRPRMGIYINAEKLLPQKRQLTLFQCSQNSYSSKYAERILCLNDRELYADSHFQTHTVSMDIAVFKYELEKMSVGNPDCIIIFNPELQHDDVKYIIENIRVPIVFIGDFIKGSFDDLNYNSIKENTGERGIAYIQAAAKIHATDVCMIGGPSDRDYIRELMTESAAKAKELSIRFRYLPFTDAGTSDIKQRYQHRKEMLCQVFSGSDIPDTLILDDFLQVDQFVQIMREMNIQPGRDIKIIETTEFNPDAYYLRVLYYDFAFQVKKLIGHLAEGNIGKVTLSGLIKRQLVESKVMEL